MGKATYILGINAYHGDASAVLLKDGSVVAAVEEERFSRMKHSAGFPSHAIRYCLRRAGISISEVDHIGISRVPSAHLINKITFVLYNRLMFTQQGLDRLRNVDRIRNIETVLADSVGVRECDLKMEFHNVEHHVMYMGNPNAQYRVQMPLQPLTLHAGRVEMSWAEGNPPVGRGYSDKLAKIFGPARLPHEQFSRHHRDIAASLQKCLEAHLFRILNALHRYTGSTNLCLAGGVAYNSVANGLIRQQTPFREIFIQPAAGDSGTARGVAFYIWNTLLGNPRTYVMSDAYLGPEYSDAELEEAIRNFGASYQRAQDVEERAAELIASG